MAKLKNQRLRGPSIKRRAPIYFCLLLFGTPVWALRIVSLMPSNTEILDALGAGKEVVGVTRYDHPEERAGHPQNVGDWITPSLETIVALHPDLVLAGYWTSSHIVPRLQAMGFQVMEIKNPTSIEGIYETIRMIAQAIGRPEASPPIIQTMRERLAKVQSQTRALPHRLRTYIEVDRPFWTVGGHDFLSEAAACAGSDNIFSDVQKSAAQVSPEMVIERNPELIISFEAKRNEIQRRAGWDTLAAVRKGFIIDDLNRDLLSRPSPRLVEGVEALAQRIQALEKQ